MLPENCWQLGRHCPVLAASRQEAGQVRGLQGGQSEPSASQEASQ